ncbi:ADP-ribosylglycohydrolase [Streptomyces sp. GKU 895]|nr:ADP-ribosylglycohydrolase [Streptomyces sp. GKU 895]
MGPRRTAGLPQPGARHAARGSPSGDALGGARRPARPRRRPGDLRRRRRRRPRARVRAARRGLPPHPAHPLLRRRLIRAQVRRDTGAWHPPTDLHRAYLRWAATQRDWGPDERRKDDGWLAREEWLYARRDPARSLLLGFGDDTMGTLDAPKSPGEAGPEAAARSAPFGLLVGWEPQLVVQLAVECAAQTHGHPVGYLAAGAYAAIVHGLARGESLDAAVQQTLALVAARPGHQPVSDALQHALGAVRQGMPTPARVGELVGAATAEGLLAAAVYCALVSEDVRHGLCLAVNHDGPSAAAGALTGGLLGALHGETALPPAWLAELEGRPTLLELADDFAMEMTQGPALHGPAGSSPGWLARYPRA